VKKVMKEKNAINVFMQEFCGRLGIFGDEKEIKKFKQEFVNAGREVNFNKLLVNVVIESGEQTSDCMGIFGFYHKSKTGLHCSLNCMPIYSNKWLKILSGKFPKLKFELFHNVTLTANSEFTFENGNLIDNSEKCDKDEEDGYFEDEIMTICARRY
jgi:hypothetical protein